MAVGVILEFDGATLEQYDELLGKMGLTPKGEGAPGGLFHWAAKKDGGLIISDCWESAEIFQKFAEERIGPLSAEVGITAPPTVTIYEVHNYLTTPTS